MGLVRRIVMAALCNDYRAVAALALTEAFPVDVQAEVQRCKDLQTADGWAG